MSDAKEDPAGGSWHLDKRVPLALIVTIIVQSIMMAVAFGGLFERVENLEQAALVTSDVRTNLVRIETRLDGVIDRLDRESDR